MKLRYWQLCCAVFQFYRWSICCLRTLFTLLLFSTKPFAQSLCKHRTVLNTMELERSREAAGCPSSAPALHTQVTVALTPPPWRAPRAGAAIWVPASCLSPQQGRRASRVGSDLHAALFLSISMCWSRDRELTTLVTHCYSRPCFGSAHLTNVAHKHTQPLICLASIPAHNPRTLHEQHEHLDSQALLPHLLESDSTCPEIVSTATQPDIETLRTLYPLGILQEGRDQWRRIPARCGRCATPAVTEHPQVSLQNSFAALGEEPDFNMNNALSARATNPQQLLQGQHNSSSYSSLPGL